MVHSQDFLLLLDIIDEDFYNLRWPPTRTRSIDIDNAGRSWLQLRDNIF